MRNFTTLPYTEYTVADGHFDKTRKPIDRIIIHTSVSTRKGLIATFGGGTRMVSAHYGIDLDGSLLAFLEEKYTAYHAGNYPMNQRSIGIEHVDNREYTKPRPDALYKTSAKLVADICKYYNIPCDRKHILKHSEVRATGCPHNLDIDRIVREANSILKGQSLSDTQENNQLRKKIEDLQKEVEDKNNQIGGYANQVEGLLKDISDLKIELKEEQDARRNELQTFASRLDTSDDATSILKEIEKLVVAEDGLHKCLKQKRNYAERNARIMSEYTKTLEELSLASGMPIASFRGVKRALVRFLKLNNANPKLDSLSAYDLLSNLLGRIKKWLKKS